MRWTKRGWTVVALPVIRWVSVIGLLGCGTLAFMPLGCMSSPQQAAIRYRAQHQNDSHLLPDFTVERFQECAETYGEQLGPIDPPFAHAKAHVQVTPEGQVVDVQVTGIPDRASDLAACTRITLREMTVPASVLSLRQKETSASTTESTTEPTAPQGNELANPIVWVGVEALLAEFAAQYGGRIVLYTVTIEVLSAAAVVAVAQLSKRCRKVKEKCIESCTNSELPTGTFDGFPFHKCFRECMERARCFYNPP